MRNLFTSILAFSLVLSFISSAQCQTQSEKLSDATWILVNSYKNNIQNSGIEKNSWFTPGRKDDKYYVTFSFEFFKNQDAGYVAYGATNSTDSQKFLFRLVDYKILTYYTESSFAADRPSKIAEIVKLTDSELIIFEKELNIDLATQQTIFTGRVNIYFFEK